MIMFVSLSGSTFFCLLFFIILIHPVSYCVGAFLKFWLFGVGHITSFWSTKFWNWVNDSMNHNYVLYSKLKCNANEWILNKSNNVYPFFQKFKELWECFGETLINWSGHLSGIWCSMYSDWNMGDLSSSVIWYSSQLVFLPLSQLT